MVLRDVLVVIHATSGVAGLVAGLFSLAPPRPGDRRGWARRLYSLCIVVLLASIVALVVMDWSGLDGGARVSFGALTGLGTVIGYRIVRARQEASTRGVNWQDRYIGHVYFTYISLWEGFIILPALTLPLPQLSVPAAALGVLLIGHALIGRYKSRVLVA